MTGLMGWCQSAPGAKPDQHHHLCRRQYKTQVGVTVTCTCPAHANDDNEDAA
jgi:hypothetical protein